MVRTSITRKPISRQILQETKSNISGVKATIWINQEIIEILSEKNCEELRWETDQIDYSIWKAPTTGTTETSQKWEKTNIWTVLEITNPHYGRSKTPPIYRNQSDQTKILSHIIKIKQLMKVREQIHWVFRSPPKTTNSARRDQMLPHVKVVDIK